MNAAVAHGRSLGECSSQSSVTAATTRIAEGAGPAVPGIFIGLIVRSSLEPRRREEIGEKLQPHSAHVDSHSDLSRRQQAL